MSGNSFSGSTGHWPTAVELSIGTPSVGRPLPARNERGEGWGEGKSNKNATPLPGPLLLLRRKRGRRARSIPLIQGQWATGLYRPATRRAERRPRPEPTKTGLLQRDAALFRSASRRPARAGRPCYPFSGHALRCATLLLSGVGANWPAAAPRNFSPIVEPGSSWVEAMKKAHARSTGTKGRFAHFGDSITMTLAVAALAAPQKRPAASMCLAW